MKKLFVIFILLFVHYLAFSQTTTFPRSVTKAELRLNSLQTRRNWAIAATATGGVLCVIGISSGITALSNGQQALRDDMKNLSSSYPTSSLNWIYADTSGSKALISIGLITSSIGIVSLLANNGKMMEAKIDFSKKLSLAVQPGGVVLSF